MTKARRMMQEDIRLIDLVIELTDARVPYSSRNPDIDELGKNKARLILLNKSDLADEQMNEVWAEHFKKKGYYTAKINARSGAGMKQIQGIIQKPAKKRQSATGREHFEPSGPCDGSRHSECRQIHFYQYVCRQSLYKDGQQAGCNEGKTVDQTEQKCRASGYAGILWPKFEDQSVGQKLAVIGSIKDEILQAEELALWILGFMQEHYPGRLKERYQVEEEGVLPELLNSIAFARGCKRKGEQPDYQKAAQLIVDDFRSGKLGRVTMESPDITA